MTRLRRPEIVEILRSPFFFLALGYVIAKLMRDPQLLPLLIVSLALIPVVVIALRWPLASLITMVAIVPFTQMTQSWLWYHGWFPPDSAARLGYAKELVVVVALWRGWQQRPRPLPRLDRLAIAVLGIVAVYTIVPIGPNSLSIRYVAARGNAGFVAVFLAARWLVGDERLRRKAELLIPAVAAVVAALGIWNRLGPDSWSGWVDSTGIIHFRNDVMNAPTLGAVEKVPFGSSEIIRAGSVLFSPNDLAYYLLVVVALLGSRMVRRVNKPWEPFVAALCTLCVFYTFSRSAMALFALAGIMLAAASGRLSRGIGVIYGTVIALVLVLVFLGGGDQLASGANASDQRTSGHIEAINSAITQIVAHPEGRGLGTTGSTSVRFNTPGFQTENFYLHVGVEVGLLAGVAVTLFVIMVLRALWRRARSAGGLAIGALAGLAAAATGGLVLETFSELGTGWTLWLLVGLALPIEASSPYGTRPAAGEASGLGTGREHRSDASLPRPA